MRGVIGTLYAKAIRQPVLMLAVIGGLCIAAGFYAPRFSFDASSDTLVVEADPSLAYYRYLVEQFGADEFLVLTFKPLNFELFSLNALDQIVQLERALEALDGVEAVHSVLDAPLLDNQPRTSTGFPDRFVTLRDSDVDLRRARWEFAASPLFSEYLVSADATATALRIDLVPATEMDALRRERDRLRGLTERTREENNKLGGIELKHLAARQQFLHERATLIREVRQIRDAYAKDATIHLGGVPMIAADMIAFVKNDMLLFGSSVLVVVAGMLYVFFRRLRWVALPIATSAVTVWLTIGWLGFVQRPATVVSSNFISLLAILTISIAIHLVVRYRELLVAEQQIDHVDRVLASMSSKFAPCLFTTLTTMVAFGSLLGSAIVPVEDFGAMMCVGVLIAFIVTFTFFPSVLVLIGRGEPSVTLGRPLRLIDTLSLVARRHRVGVLSTAVVTVIAAGIGIGLVSLDNRFIDYFDDDTDINRGMTYIDRQLGGTVPLEVIVSFPPYEGRITPADDFFFEEEDFPERYWFTPDKLQILLRLHRFIESHPAVGKVISIATLELIGRGFNDGQPLNAVQMVAALGAFPPDQRAEVITPYASPGTGELRISVRTVETGPYYSRDALLADIELFASESLGLEPGRVRTSGMFVLFNDMLRQLFTSQATSLVYVILATLAMFLVLLRSPLLAFLGVFPNALAAGTIIGVMGYAAIPLDVMTITIAAISIGIGVDDSIHYLYRFRREFGSTSNAEDAVRRTHASIGRAMYFTSLTVISGFSILSFSNFVPTVYFGLLTALAMALALLANLTVLPSMLILAFGSTNRDSTLAMRFRWLRRWF
jgi:predicted RND superfamily exporter protein